MDSLIIQQGSDALPVLDHQLLQGEQGLLPDCLVLAVAGLLHDELLDLQALDHTRQGMGYLRPRGQKRQNSPRSQQAMAMFLSSRLCRISLSFLISWKSFCSNFMAFSFQKRSVCTELHSSTSLFSSFAYFQKFDSTLMLFSSTAFVFRICSSSYSFFMFPFSSVSIIFSSRASISSSRHAWLFSRFLKIRKATRVSFSLDSFCSTQHTLFSTPYLGTAMNFSTATSTKESSQTLSSTQYRTWVSLPLDRKESRISWLPPFSRNTSASPWCLFRYIRLFRRQKSDSFCFVFYFRVFSNSSMKFFCYPKKASLGSQPSTMQTILAAASQVAGWWPSMARMDLGVARMAVLLVSMMPATTSLRTAGSQVRTASMVGRTNSMSSRLLLRFLTTSKMASMQRSLSSTSRACWPSRLRSVNLRKSSMVLGFRIFSWRWKLSKPSLALFDTSFRAESFWQKLSEQLWYFFVSIVLFPSSGCGGWLRFAVLLGCCFILTLDIDILQSLLVVGISSICLTITIITTGGARVAVGMSSSIPNVSSIYRDLSHLYSNTSHLGPSQGPQDYSLENRNKISQPTCFEDMYAYKQQRHNELMARLRNSCEEHRSIVGGTQTITGDSGGYNGHYQSPYQPMSYNSSGPSSMGQPRTSKFVMPKIRYRHIEDQVQPSPMGRPVSSPANYPQENAQLQQQFYEDMSANLYKNLSSQPIGIQTNPNAYRNIEEDDGKSEISNKTGNVGRGARNNSKYEDKIESYYELCRKNLGNLTVDKEKEKEKQSKYMRVASGKTKAMKLDQAIKLLSLD